MRRLEPYEPGKGRFVFCKDILITTPVSALCQHNLKNNAPPGRWSIKNLKHSSVSYTGDVFELCEANHRAIVEALNSSDLGTHESEQLVKFETSFFDMALQDQVLVRWKYWDRKGNMTSGPRVKIDEMRDD
eukprot:4667873-Pleurochrysis_carterae.AAC.2